MMRNSSRLRRAASSASRPLRRAVLAALLLLPLAGSPAAEEMAASFGAAATHLAPTASPARFTDSAFITADGVSLPLRKWLPQGEVKAVILALHGFNDYSNAFTMPAPRLLRAIYPGRPIYLLGESMGGGVAILAATGIDGVPPAEAEGLILSAPAVWGRPTMDFWPKLALFAAVRFFPEMELTGRGLGIKPSDNLPMLKALMKDPMVIKGARVATIYGLVDLMDTALDAAPRLQMPFLLLYGAHDEIVPRGALAEFVAALPPDPAHRRRLAYYRNGYHLLLRDVEGAAVAGGVADWAFDRKAPLPSHADRREAVRPWPPGKDGGS